jgi:hypothetical protein
MDLAFGSEATLEEVELGLVVTAVNTFAACRDRPSRLRQKANLSIVKVGSLTRTSRMMASSRDLSGTSVYKGRREGGRGEGTREGRREGGKNGGGQGRDGRKGLRYLFGIALHVTSQEGQQGSWSARKKRQRKKVLRKLDNARN